MKDIIPAKKQSPILGLAGMGGGVGSNLGGSLAKKTYVDDVFSTYLYNGNSSEGHVINNGIDLAGEGGFVWVKKRSGTDDHVATHVPGTILFPNTTGAASTGNTNFIESFNSNGFTLGGGASGSNASGETTAAWTWRKAPGFFDVVTYTGTGSTRTVAHNLGCVPGLIMIKCTSNAESWIVYHREVGAEKYLILNNNGAAGTSSSAWNNTAPTSTHFTVSTAGQSNDNGYTYVAYVFAGGASSAATARSVDFDGSGDTLSIPSNALFNDIDGVDFTMECYAKFDSHGSHDGIIHNVTNSGWTGGSWVFEPVSGVLNFYYYNASSTGHVVGGSIPIGQWQHMAITKSGRTITIYQDGIKTGSGNISGNIRTATNPLIIGGQCVGADMDGKVSNVRITIGQVLYTSSFIPSTQPLTTTSQGATASNVKLLCCNDASVTGSTVTTGTITANGNPAPSTNNPFDDPEAFKFGEEGDQNLIKCGSYTGNGNATIGTSVHLGFEPQWVLIKPTGFAEHWHMFDDMRGVVNIGNASNGNGSDRRLEANQSGGEYTSADFVEFHSDGFKALFNTNVNANNENFIYIAMRRPDGLVAKPAEAGTDAFTMDTGNGSSSIPCFDSGFPVDFQLMRQPASTDNWYTGSRLTGPRNLETNSANSDNNSDIANWVFDDNTGCLKGYGATWQSWMWKRGAGFDLLAYKGNNKEQRQLKHNLGQNPEMIWVKSRESTYNWQCWHKDLTSGRHLVLNSSDNESTSNSPGLGTVSATTFNVGSYVAVNQNNAYYMATLFSSVTGVSKVGSFAGSSSDVTLNLGFVPRFLMVKGRTGPSGTNWTVWDNIRGITGNYISGGADTPRIYLNATTASSVGANDNVFAVNSGGVKGITIVTGPTWNNNQDYNYIYYAHA